VTKLGRFLVEHGISHAECARRADVSRPTIVGLCNGQAKRASLETWVKLARALGCNVYEISEEAYAQMVGAV
jgi:DNA-binding XRE family transcriptional regulator